MINAFGNYIGFGNPQIYPLFKTSGQVDTYNVGLDTVFVFHNYSGSIPTTGTGSIQFSQNYRVEYLVVAGGGSGGIESGGGGAGGYKSGSFTAIAKEFYNIGIGSGGQYYQPTGSAPDYGFNGAPSFITGSNIPFQVLCLGGGGGAGSMADNRDQSFSPAGNGGSGGGGGGNIQVQLPGSGSVGQGFAGGSGSLSLVNNFPAPATPRSYWIGGGGGGASSVGISGSTFTSTYVYAKPGNGGSGSFSYIGSTTGSWYAGGGGADYVIVAGGSNDNWKYNDYTLYPTGSGGIGGGGNAYQNGFEGTGGGGGCSGNDYRSATPPAPAIVNNFGNGGSGIVILRVNLQNPLPA
jgi:hypothetical protein